MAGARLEEAKKLSLKTLMNEVSKRIQSGEEKSQGQLNRNAIFKKYQDELNTLFPDDIWAPSMYALSSVDNLWEYLTNAHDAKATTLDVAIRKTEESVICTIMNDGDNLSKFFEKYPHAKKFLNHGFVDYRYVLNPDFNPNDPKMDPRDQLSSWKAGEKKKSLEDYEIAGGRSKGLKAAALLLHFTGGMLEIGEFSALSNNPVYQKKIGISQKEVEEKLDLYKEKAGAVIILSSPKFSMELYRTLVEHCEEYPHSGSRWLLYRDDLAKNHRECEKILRERGEKIDYILIDGERRASVKLEKEFKLSLPFRLSNSHSQISKGLSAGGEGVMPEPEPEDQDLGLNIAEVDMSPLNSGISFDLSSDLSSENSSERISVREGDNDYSFASPFPSARSSVG